MTDGVEHLFMCLFPFAYLFWWNSIQIFCLLKLGGFSFYWGCFPRSLVVENLSASAGDTGLIPGLGRSSGVGNGNLLQSSCLEDSMDRGAWWATVHGVAKSQTRLNNWAHGTVEPIPHHHPTQNLWMALTNTMSCNGNLWGQALRDPRLSLLTFWSIPSWKPSAMAVFQPLWDHQAVREAQAYHL